MQNAKRPKGGKVMSGFFSGPQWLPHKTDAEAQEKSRNEDSVGSSITSMQGTLKASQAFNEPAWVLCTDDGDFLLPGHSSLKRGLDAAGDGSEVYVEYQGTYQTKKGATGNAYEVVKLSDAPAQPSDGKLPF